MDSSTKRQLVGAAVIVALAVIFLPMFFTGPEKRESVDVPLEVPPRPDEQSRQGTPRMTDDMADEESPRPQFPARADEQRSAAQQQRQSRRDDRGEQDDGQADGTTATKTDVAVGEEGAYAVQVGSFRHEENAYGERDRLRDLGMPAYVDSGEIGGSPMYRVRLGPVMERDEAEHLLDQAMDEAGLEGWVVSL